MQSMARSLTLPWGERFGAGGASRTLLLALVAGALVGCTGSVVGDSGGGPGPKGPGDNTNPPGPGGGTGGTNGGGMNMGPGGSGAGPGPMPVMPGTVNVGISPLRRLTAEQYRNTVRDLLLMPDAKTLVLTTDLPADGNIADRFSGNTAGALAGLDADTYGGLAEKLATKAVANLQPLLPCQPSAGKACATQFIQSFGKRAFRRPLSATEVTRFETVFTTGSTGGTFANGIKLVIQAMLQSPKFLYIIEPIPANGAGKVFQIDSWAMATRLSYFFLGSMPDAGLFTAAEANQLTTADQVAEQAARLVKDNHFRDTLASFHNEWLELDSLESADKDAMLFPTWNDALKTALGQQTQKFIEGVIADGDGKLATLMAANFSYLSGPLYDIYGVPKPASATAWAKVDLKPAERAGLLTHAGILAGLAHENRTSFILRGKLVREAILCFQVPPPPAGVDTSESMISPTATAKERSEAHRRNPSCASCHAAFDTIGFAFEGYDPIGRYRTVDGAGKPIDTVGTLTGVSMALDGDVPNAVALSKKLSTAEEVGQCVARMWMRFGLGREEDDKGDAASLAAAFKAMKDSGSITDTLVALARSDSFRHQKVNP
jgi:hypothetical protein